MTDTTGRAAARYLSDEAGEISLPGYLDALPSIVGPGDVFAFDAAFADELFAAARFEEADLYDVSGDSPNEASTKRQLVDKIVAAYEAHPDYDPAVPADRAALLRQSKPTLVELADEIDRETPVPPSDPDDQHDDAGDGTEGSSDE